MPYYTLVFHGGPCDGLRSAPTIYTKPPPTLRCRGADYILDPRRSTDVLSYSSALPPPDADASFELGRRDVGTAWSRLMRAFGQGTANEVAALWRARAQVRRSVR